MARFLLPLAIVFAETSTLTFLSIESLVSTDNHPTISSQDHVDLVGSRHENGTDATSPYEQIPAIFPISLLLDSPNSFKSASPGEIKADDPLLLHVNVGQGNGDEGMLGPNEDGSGDHRIRNASAVIIPDGNSTRVKTTLGWSDSTPATTNSSFSGSGPLTRTAKSEFEQFCEAMVIPFITDPTAFDGPRSTMLDICLSMTNHLMSDNIKDMLVDTLPQ